MDRIALNGGRALSGAVGVSGSKNACLPIMTAAILTGETLELSNVPDLADIGTMSALLGSFGIELWRDRARSTVSLRAARIENHVAHYDIVRKMRASILALGPLLARGGEAIVSLPGGCAIGARPVDLHLEGLAAMGAELDLKDGYIHAAARGGLRGARVAMRSVSVGATENLLCAATLARGITVLENAAREPEIVDLAACLGAMGARIEGAGGDTIRIEGVETLGGAHHRVIGDRIEMGTYMIAAAITGGQLEITGGERRLVEALIGRLDAAGVGVEETAGGLRVARRGDHVRAVDIETEPFPGFATDLQAQMMALMTLADGTSRIDERIFENRFMHAPELVRMGADIRISGGVATVRGVEKLRGAPVMATDLRASVSLVLAGLAAEGRTQISRIYHLDRGYENVEAKLSAVGADIRRLRADEADAA